uniref:Uncharacterized protein n=1 Tax=Cacopsylla melanoneura TaxID=428564 RepID=A0A8D9EC50_9HEMI
MPYITIVYKHGNTNQSSVTSVSFCIDLSEELTITPNMISILSTSWIFMTISLTLISDQCFAESTVPFQSAYPAPGEPLGIPLPQAQFDKLCQMPAQPDLCKNCMQGVADMGGSCAAIAKELGFSVHQCMEVIPNTKEKDNKYNVCSLANSKLPLDDPGWYHATAEKLDTYVTHKQKCKDNGLSMVIVKVNKQ